MPIETADLPLRSRTPDTWAAQALGDPLALLNDHAHLEKKAANNALELVNRWPDPTPPEYWVEKMTAIARDEIEHLGVVTRLLSRRGGHLTKQHANPYASELRNLVRLGLGPTELIDRLMIAALIEARSCERFEVLSRNCPDEILAKLYRGLWASEHGHYHVFIDLAYKVLPDRSRVDQRWDELLATEAKILAAQAPGARMHSGWTP
jgi:tRNA-(ms[2]io[6]A)-hydroxylase